MNATSSRNCKEISLPLLIASVKLNFRMVKRFPLKMSQRFPDLGQCLRTRFLSQINISLTFHSELATVAASHLDDLTDCTSVSKLFMSLTDGSMNEEYKMLFFVVYQSQVGLQLPQTTTHIYISKLRDQSQTTGSVKLTFQHSNALN